jgi:hypothetical protein
MIRRQRRGMRRKGLFRFLLFFIFLAAVNSINVSGRTALFVTRVTPYSIVTVDLDTVDEEEEAELSLFSAVEDIFNLIAILK